MSSRPRALGQAVVVVLLVVLVGAVAGLVWQWLWDPPRGVVMNHRWVQDEVGLRGDFAGTGTYVAVATVAGLLAGLGVALSSRRHELVTLVALVVGSLLAGWVMYRVGVALAPPSPGPAGPHRARGHPAAGDAAGLRRQSVPGPPGRGPCSG